MAYIELYNKDNKEILREFAKSGRKFNLIYCDMMYDNLDFKWIDICQPLLEDTGSIFVQTDQRSVAQLKLHLDKTFGEICFRNWIIWPYNWGGRGRRNFAKKHDDILWYSQTNDYKFFPERVSIPKVTAKSKQFNPSGRETQIPTDVWSDIGNFHTTSKERIRNESGVSIKWQKPTRLLDRIILSTTDEGDWVLDPFMGTSSTGVSCLRNNRHFVGIEWDKRIYNIAEKRIKNEQTY